MAVTFNISQLCDGTGLTSSYLQQCKAGLFNKTDYPIENIYQGFYDRGTDFISTFLANSEPITFAAQDVRTGTWRMTTDITNTSHISEYYIVLVDYTTLLNKDIHTKFLYVTPSSSTVKCADKINLMSQATYDGPSSTVDAATPRYWRPINTDISQNIYINGVQLKNVYFNNQKIENLYFNGIKIMPKSIMSFVEAENFTKEVFGGSDNIRDGYSLHLYDMETTDPRTGAPCYHGVISNSSTTESIIFLYVDFNSSFGISYELGSWYDIDAVVNDTSLVDYSKLHEI